MGMGCACRKPIGLGYAGLGYCVDGVDSEDGSLCSDANTSSVGSGYTPEELASMGYSLDSSGSGYPTYNYNTNTYNAAKPATPPNPATTSMLASLAAQWTSIAGQTIAPQTTIKTASGLNIQAPAAQTSALSNLFGGAALTGATGSTITSMLPLALLAAAGILAFKAISK